MLIPLHVKSHYSLGCGTTPIAKLVERAAVLGLSAMGLTDTENLYGQVMFHRLAREKGVRPITGVELQGAAPVSSHDSQHGQNRNARSCRLVLLAKNRTGYENLCRIVTRRKLGGKTDSAPDDAGDPEPCLDPVESLRGHLHGLFVLAEEPWTLERVLSLPGVDHGSLRLLLVRPGGSITAEAELREASRRLSIPLLADPDVIFLDPGDRSLHALQLAIGKNSLLSRMEEEGLLPAEGRHFPGPRECGSLFGDVPEAVEATRSLAEQCDLDLRRARPIFPRLSLPDGETPYSHLAKISFRGLERRFSRISSRHMGRLVTELRIIEDLGFCEYFVVVGDIVRFAREQGIEVVGRGSGAGSLVAHVLGITNVDPVEYGLYFERFLHPGRTDLPDIDVDLCWIRRDEVIDYVYRTYGRDRVAMISSHVTFQPHMAFREAIKAFGVPIEEVNRLSRKLPYIYPSTESDTPLRELIRSSTGARDLPLNEEPFLSAIPLAERLLNHPHHLSIHPGGIVIADRDMDSYVPLERAAKGIVVTQYDMYTIEDVGLVKIDLLGNRCLTELQETLELVSADPPDPGGERATETRLSLRDIPDADPATVEFLGSARTIGCFQLESPAMRSLLSKLRAANIRDCIAAVAIIRPGAAAGGAKEAFVRRRNGEELPEYLHPSLRRLLEESHGIVIYEEDVMCIASAIAGISLAEGDRLRSALKKARHPDDARDLENDFLRRAVQHGIEPDVAAAVWKDLRKFSAYCFSKAHAAGYGVLAYQSAYLKAHFPVEFGCAVLNNHAGMYSTRTIAEEVKRQGVKLLHPSVNRSEARFTVERCEEDAPPGATDKLARKAIRTGLGRLKGLSMNSIEASLTARRTGGPFRSLADFLTRVSAPRREVEALILAGAFDELPPPPGSHLPPNHPQLLWELHSSSVPSRAARPRETAATSPESPTDLIPSTFPPRGLRHGRETGTMEHQALLDLQGGSPDYPPLEPYDAMTRIRHELEILEMGITDHPMRILREEARRRRCISTGEAASRVGRRVRVAGILAATRKIRTVKGDWMRFLTIEDEEGLLEATLFPRVHKAFSSRIQTLGPYIIEGQIESDHGALNLTVSRVEPWPTPE